MTKTTYTHDQLTDVIHLAADVLMREDDRYNAGPGASHKPNVQELVRAMMLRGAIAGRILQEHKISAAVHVEDLLPDEKRTLLESYLPGM